MDSVKEFCLEKDRQEERIRENKRLEEDRKDRALNKAKEYGTSLMARPVSIVVQEMLQNRVYRKLIWKCDIILDMGIPEALTEACIQLGLSDEGFEAWYGDDGDQIEIRLV